MISLIREMMIWLLAI